VQHARDVTVGKEPIVGADLLRTEWRLAFDAAETALRASGHDLPDRMRRAEAARLKSERESTAALLRALAHDQHSSDQFLHRLMQPDEALRLLGLPPGVTSFVFRLDGVLIGSAAVHAAAWAETFDEFIFDRAERTHRAFVSFDRQRDYVAHIHGKPRLEGVRAFLASRGIRLPEGDPDDPPGAETVHGLANRKNQALVRRLNDRGVSALEGSRHYLEIAHDAGVHSAVVSASAHTYMILARAGLADFIDDVVDAKAIEEEHLREEPAPDWLLAACERLGVEPEHVAVFETDPAGVAAGHVGGFKVVVGVDHMGRPDTLRAAGADVVIEGLTDLLDHDLASWL
jgi:HAD superfamily hydrolase (TIGR01509 family)